MKNKVRLLFFFIAFFSIASVKANEQSIENRIKALPNIISVTKIAANQFFNEAFEIIIEQKLDYSNPETGTFQHRIVLSHYNKFSPVVFVTEGYRADYATRSSYINELSTIVEANQLVVEHRYFGKSMPEDLNWDYLTLENSMNDLHEIYELFQQIYTESKWIATGISKGGQTTLAYKTFFPSDMDIWIPYVAPLNFKLEEKRHDRFLSTVGSKQLRKEIFEFQNQILDARDTIQVLLDSLVAANHFTYNIPQSDILDYCVLEYPFAFMQWGSSIETIPDDAATIQTKFKHLIAVSPCDYFSHQGIEPIKACFVQFSNELGYYGYNMKPFKKKMNIKSTKGYFNKIFLPENLSIKYNNRVSKRVQKMLKQDGDHILLIYGEIDPWSATAVELSKDSKAVKIVSPNKCHRARINNLPMDLKAKVYMQIENWLTEK